MSDFGWAELEQDEIIASNKGHIKWNIKNGAIVRAGQLMATSSLNACSPASGEIAHNDAASPNFIQESDGLHGNGNGNGNGNLGVMDQGEPAKPTIIRARRINRKVKPIAASTLPTTSAAGLPGAATATETKSSSVFPSSNINSADHNSKNSKTVDPAAIAKDVNTSKSGSSFLGQYLKSAVNTHRKASESRPPQKKINATSKATNTSTTPSQSSINSNSNTTSTSTSSTKLDHSKEIRAHMNGFLRIYLTPQCRKDPNNNHELVYVLGKIEKCAHPAIIDGLCAVCGQPANSDSSPESNPNMAPTSTSALEKHHRRDNDNVNVNAEAENHERDSFTLVGGVTISISSEYARTYSTDTFQSLRTAKKLNLVLDLDHTLLHATADRRASSWIGKIEDVHTLLLPLMEGHPLQQQQQGSGSKLNWLQPHYVKLRPYLAEFLCRIMDQYEVSIYTAGTRMYAEKIADLISRHVADYQRRLNTKGKGSTDDGDGDDDGSNTKNCVDKCLDEGDLLMLKEHVARTKDHMGWCKSRKERQDFVAKMNEQFQLQQKLNVEQKKTAAEVEVLDANDLPHMLAGSDEDDEMMSKGNRRKRKRVTFSLPEKDTDDNNDNTKDDSNDNDDDKEMLPAKETNNDTEFEFENSRKTLRDLEEKLDQAEKKEAEALHIRKKIFGSRIISRTDVGDLGRDVKSLKRVFPCGGMMAAIVDDREDVWANATNNSTGMKGEPPDNLLFVRPYHWAPFQKFADVNNSAGEDITLQSESRKEEDNISPDESNERQLLWTTDILTRIHDRYYDSLLTEEQRDKLTVPGILKLLRKEIFENAGPPAKFILSGLVPLHKQRASGDFNNSPRPLIIRYAEEMGAKIENEVTRDLTHVIAARDGTDKILRARRIPGCAVVKVTWLMECYWSCTLRDIDSHILGPKPLPAAQPISSLKRSILLMESDSSEEDDDGFFDNFEKEMEE